jgi:hypothetical protein
MAKQGRDQNGDADRHHGADREAQLYPLGERLAGGVEQCRAELVGELPGHRHGATEGVARRFRRMGWDPGRDGVGQLTAVHAGTGTGGTDRYGQDAPYLTGAGRSGSPTTAPGWSASTRSTSTTRPTANSRRIRCCWPPGSRSWSTSRVWTRCPPPGPASPPPRRACAPSPCARSRPFPKPPPQLREPCRQPRFPSDFPPLDAGPHGSGWCR